MSPTDFFVTTANQETLDCLEVSLKEMRVTPYTGRLLPEKELTGTKILVIFFSDGIVYRRTNDCPLFFKSVTPEELLSCVQWSML